MLKHSLMTLAALALAFGASARADELKLLSTNALASVLEDLGPKFEQASGHKLAITLGTSAQIKTDIEKGASAGAAILTDAGADDLIKSGKLAARTPLARSGIAVAVHKGAPKPKLDSADDLKKLLLTAKSIAWVEQGASAIYLREVLQRLGITDQIKDKFKSVKAAGEAVAKGEAEIGLTQVSEILPHPGAEVGGMLPPDVQKFTTFVVAVRDKDAKASAALVQFFKTPAAAATIKAKGLEPL